ncbi:MAG: hypothetical protein H7A21_18030 [Spirochaetales bacterium]|nr:hypothetical protein [Leptospiraceae bacterium]MCP5483340.1 hypothetical protein [Spirochaetales bacterium]MCP5484129.1 hypothetical protein [Spirochaetales bacterium]
MTVTGSKSALGLALVVALGAAPGPVRMTGEEAAAPEMPSFLLPAPLSGGQSDRMRQLFSAPVLNGGLLESMADENELASRRALIERQHALAVSLCALEAGAREQELMRLRRLQQRQLLRWMGVQERYEHMLAFRLHEELLGAEQLDQEGALLEARRVVRTLQQERQRLIAHSWQEFFGALEDRLDSEFCPAPPAAPSRLNCSGRLCTAAERTQADPEQMYREPEELLYLPYYVALYRFLRRLPPEIRARLVLAGSWARR